MIHFIDTNIPMYAVGAEHPLKKPCLAILEAVATGALTAVTDIEVLQEILHRYTALGSRTRAVEVVRLFLQVVPEALPITFGSRVGSHAVSAQWRKRAAAHGNLGTGAPLAQAFYLRYTHYSETYHTTETPADIRTIGRPQTYT
ncbi:MAG: type II toxin-antitoxin system VapC family toxin [Roseiflexaceae bacterium]